MKVDGVMETFKTNIGYLDSETMKYYSDNNGLEEAAKKLARWIDEKRSSDLISYLAVFSLSSLDRLHRSIHEAIYRLGGDPDKSLKDQKFEFKDES